MVQNRFQCEGPLVELADRTDLSLHRLGESSRMFSDRQFTFLWCTVSYSGSLSSGVHVLFHFLLRKS